MKLFLITSGVPQYKDNWHVRNTRFSRPIYTFSSKFKLMCTTQCEFFSQFLMSSWSVHSKTSGDHMSYRSPVCWRICENVKPIYFAGWNFFVWWGSSGWLEEIAKLKGKPKRHILEACCCDCFFNHFLLQVLFQPTSSTQVQVNVFISEVTGLCKQLDDKW